MQHVALPGAELEFEPAFLSPREAAAALAAVRNGVPWERHRMRLFGRELEMPRLSCWIGDPVTAYRYSGTLFQPRPWPPALLALRARVAVAARVELNSVLANLYRDGSDAMGWHSDDEPELGAQPVIASLSLGAARRFVLRRRDQRSLRHELLLTPGSLLLMRGDTQRHWQHALPRTARAVGERINLTFRRII